MAPQLSCYSVIKQVSFSTVLGSLLRWPTTVTANPKTSRQKQNTSRQNQKPHGKTENLTAKPRTSWQNQKLHGKNKIPHGKTKDLTAKLKTSQQKPNTSWQNQIPLAKPKLFCFCCEVFGFAVRFLFLP